MNADSWASALRELALIVAGVLIAIWVSNLNEARHDRAREHATLVQLLNVTRENEQRLFESASGDSFVVNNIRKTRDALSGKATTDSLWLWLKGSFAAVDFDPLLGVYEATAQNGSLNLVRNDSLRDMIARFTGEIVGTTEQIRGTQPLVLPVVAGAGYHLESQGIQISAPNITEKQIRALQNDNELKKAIYFLWPYHGRHWILTRRALKSVATLRKALERELDVPAVEPHAPPGSRKNRI